MHQYSSTPMAQTACRTSGPAGARSRTLASLTSTPCFQRRGEITRQRPGSNTYGGTVLGCSITSTATLKGSTTRSYQ